MQPTQVFLPGESQGQRSLTGYSPWDLKQLGTTECACTHTHTHTHLLFIFRITKFKFLIGTLIFQQIIFK